MLGERLKLARSKAGLSLRALAEKANGVVTAQAIGKYERGEMRPGSQALIALAKALGEPASFFMASTGARLGDVDFRKFSSVSAKERSAVKAIVLDVLDRYLEIEEILGIPSDAWKHPPGFPRKVESLEDAESAANALRQTWDLGHDPIPSLSELLEEKGFKVLQLDLPEKVSGFTCLVERPLRDPVRGIACNRKHGIERRRLTMAHEVGHAAMIVSKDVKEERACQVFASAFLAPAALVRSKAGERRTSFAYREVMELKKFFGISASSLMARCAFLGIISSASYQSYCKSPRGQEWRIQEPEPLVCGENSQWDGRFMRLCLRALSEESISLSKACELLRQTPQEVRQLMVG